MTLGELYRAYLEHELDPSQGGRLARALLEVYPIEGRLLEAHVERGPGRHTIDDRGTPVVVHTGAAPPMKAEIGAVWFDTCELVRMVLLGNYVDPETLGQLAPSARATLQPSLGWMALRPVAGWQFEGFLDVTQVVASPNSRFQPLDRSRIVRVPEIDPVHHVNCTEADLYGAWFGKTTRKSDRFRCAIVHQALGDLSRDRSEIERELTAAALAITTGTPDPVRLAEIRLALARSHLAHDRTAALERAQLALREFPRDGDLALRAALLAATAMK